MHLAAAPTAILLALVHIVSQQGHYSTPKSSTYPAIVVVRGLASANIGTDSIEAALLFNN